MKSILNEHSKNYSKMKFFICSDIGRKILISCVLIIFLLTNISHAQYKLPTLAPVSPDAASISKYVEAPVSLYNGVPQIDIPLYTISYKGLNVPIGLSYNASGIRIEEVASSVGAGWSLSFGGSISRIVRGAPDELPNGYIAGQKWVYKLAPETGGLIPEAERRALVRNIVSDIVDGQPDIFILSLPGFSCKFFFDEDAIIHTIPQSKVKIVPGAIGGLGYRHWTVTTPDGVKYELGSTDGSELGGGIEKTRVFNNCQGTFSETYSNWYLNKITPLAGEPITFEYDSYTTNYTTNGNQRKHNFIDAELANGSGGGECYGDFVLCTSTITSFAKKIRRIHFNNGSILFQPSDENRMDLGGDKKIDQIMVFNKSGVPIKKYVFYHSYRGTTPVAQGSMGKRLFLDSLGIFDRQICDDLGCEYNPQVYKFNYNSQLLPPRNSLSQDYWGYYNGVNNGEYLIPKMIISYYYIGTGLKLFDLEGADRIPNEQFTKSGVLEQITYPTGGSLMLDYELNDVQSGVPYFKTQQASYYYSYPTPPPDDDLGGIFNVTTCDDKPKIVHFVATGVMVPPDPSNPNDNKQQWIIYKWNAAANDFTEHIGALGSLTEQTLDRTYYLTAGMYKVVLYKPPTSAPQYDATILIDWKNDIDCFKRPAGGLRVKETKFRDGIRDEDILITKYSYNSLLEPLKSSGAVPNFPEFHHITKQDVATIITIAGETTIWIDKCIFYQRNSITQQPMATTGVSGVGYTNITATQQKGNIQLGKTEYTFESPLTVSDDIPTEFPFAPVNSYEWKRGVLKKQEVFRSVGTNAFEHVQITENVYNTIEQENYKGLKAGVDDYDLEPAFGGIQDYSVPKEQYFDTGTGFNYLITTKTTTFDQKDITRFHEIEQTSVANTSNYQTAYTQSFNSKHELVTTNIKYISDYNTTTTSDAMSNSIKNLKNKNVLIPPVETYTIIKDPNNNEWVTGGQLIKYNDFGLPENVYQLNMQAPVALSSFVPGNINASGTFIKDSRYQLVAVYNYDNKGNTIEQFKDKDIHTTIIWDYNQELPIAECANCEGPIAYTSFETEGNGNWTIGSPNRTYSSITGATSYNLTDGTISMNGLFTGGSGYIVSYWSRNGVCSVSGTTGDTKQGKTVTISGVSWTYYEHLVVGSSTTISGTATIDELRLYPTTGMMSTYTHIPLVGISSKCDANSTITYFTYDMFGQLKMIRDQEGNTLKTFEYKYRANADQ